MRSKWADKSARIASCAASAKEARLRRQQKQKQRQQQAIGKAAKATPAFVVMVAAESWQHFTLHDFNVSNFIIRHTDSHTRPHRITYQIILIIITTTTYTFGSELYCSKDLDIHFSFCINNIIIITDSSQNHIKQTNHRTTVSGVF